MLGRVLYRPENSTRHKDMGQQKLGHRLIPTFMSGTYRRGGRHGNYSSICGRRIAGSLITWALCAANTMYEEKLKKVKTNEDMLKLADSEQLRKALKRMCWKTTMYLSPLLREAQEKRIDEWLGEEADPEWRE